MNEYKEENIFNFTLILILVTACLFWYTVLVKGIKDMAGGPKGVQIENNIKGLYE